MCASDHPTPKCIWPNNTTCTGTVCEALSRPYSEASGWCVPPDERVFSFYILAHEVCLFISARTPTSQTRTHTQMAVQFLKVDSPCRTQRETVWLVPILRFESVIHLTKRVRDFGLWGLSIRDSGSKMSQTQEKAPRTEKIPSTPSLPPNWGWKQSVLQRWSRKECFGLERCDIRVSSWEVAHLWIMRLDDIWIMSLDNK